MNGFIRLLGAGLLVLTGYGCGAAACRKKQEAWRQLHTFTLLLWYLQSLLEYQTLPIDKLLAGAAQHTAFAPLKLDDCRSFAELSVPCCMETSLRDEITMQLAGLSLAPRRQVCATLRHLHTLCEQETGQAAARAQDARNLYPRLGVCAGILAAVLFL